MAAVAAAAAAAAAAGPQLAVASGRAALQHAVPSTEVDEAAGVEAPPAEAEVEAA